MRTMEAALIACMALLLPVPAMATTYYYTGPNYVTNANDPTYAPNGPFGNNMTGSVTFDFDTSAYTGAISGLASITDLQLTSGTYTLDASTAPYVVDTFTLTSGAITSWQVAICSTTSCVPQNLLMVTCSSSGGPNCGNPPEDVVEYDQYGAAEDAGGETGTGSPPYAQGEWATPLPAALPLFASGLGAMGFFGWRRKRKAAAANVTA
jgi:hypothetical protein